MQWETSCVTGFAHCHQDQKLNDSRVCLSLKLCFGLGYFVILSVSEFLFWVTLQSPLQVNPAATAGPVRSDSTWKTRCEMCWMTGMTQLQQEAWEKIREIFALCFISSTLWNLALLKEIAYYVLHSPFQNTQSALSHITSSINPQNSPCVHNLSQRESTAILARCVLARAWSCFKTYIKPTWNQEESVHLSHTAWVH